METKKLLGFIVAILAVLFAVSFVAAGNLAVSIDEVSVNDVSNLDASTLVLSAAPGETVPVVVKFTANSDLSDLKLKVWIDGYKSDISASTARFSVIADSTYIKRLAITMPNVQDMKDNLNEDLTLHVRIADKNDETEEQVYAISLEKESYNYNVLYVDAPNAASAGEIISVNVVLRNTGTDELDDSFVTASIPELGISKKVYFGDLQSQDDESDNLDNARERNIYLVIPSDAKSGDYLLQVSASNYDASATVKKGITISGSAVTNGSSAVDIGTEDGDRIPNSILVLTIVLVVIFVVLLVVLIVLLTKKPADKSEDYGETSYY